VLADYNALLDRSACLQFRFNLRCSRSPC
jgi:hypothetical protein